MKNLFGVYCTDGKARNDISFTIPALEDMIWQGSDGIPCHISHDLHQFIGWTVVSGLYISHEMSYVVGNSFIPENDQETGELQHLRRATYIKAQEEKSKPYIEDFLNLLHSKKLTSDKGKWIYNGVLMYGYKNLLIKSFPSLKDLMDDDGMILLEDLLRDFHYVTQGVFAHNKSELVILLHPYFRRSYSHYNNFNFGFIDLLWAAYKQGNKSIKVLLDPDFIGFTPSFVENLEFDYWYGPKYNDDITTIKEGVSHYENDEISKIYSNIKFTEFVWTKKDDGKEYQFEMEEVIDAPSPTLPKGSYGCRYLHALYNLEKGTFNHFDGAIRCYDSDLMCTRIETPIDKMGHRANYQKIFRMDGIIPLNQWKALITQYLHSNDLVYEYFGIKQPLQEDRKIKRANKEEQLHNYVPYPLNEGDGVRLLISYTNILHGTRSDREFLASERTTLRNNQESIIAEFATVEVYKALNRVGAQIALPEGIVYYKSCDSYNYIPCIHHTGQDLDKKINSTLNGIRELIKAHVSHGDSERYSLSLSWIIENKTICISFMGHIIDLHEWLRSFETIPVEREDLKQWMIAQNQYIHSHGQDSSHPADSNYIKSDGVLFFQRHDIREHVTIQDIETDIDGKLKLHLEIEDLNKYLYSQLKNGSITYVPRLIIYDATDQNTKKSYLKSPASAVFRETTYILDCELMGFNWAIKENH